MRTRLDKFIKLWFVLIGLPICALTLLLGAYVWENYVSQPGQGGNAKIGWGQVCQAGKCQSAAVLYGAIPISTDPLIAALMSRPGIKLLCLDSQGGNAKGAANLARWIAQQQYDTCLPQFGTDQRILARCASACTSVFVAGQRRFMTPGAVFQVHSGAIPWLRDLYGEPQEYGPTARPPSTLVRLVEPLNAAAASFGSSWWSNPTNSPPGQRLQIEAKKTPSYRIRTIPSETLLEWGVLTEPASQSVVFGKPP